MKNKSVISLFSGAGGLDLGLKRAGFSTRLFVEIDSDARETLRLNLPKCKLSEPGDIHGLSPSELLLQSGLEPGNLDLLAGGPPCQPFSKSGYWVTGDSNRLDDPRADTLRAYLDIVRESLPRALLLENVKGIAFSKKDEGLQLLINELEGINRRYKTNYIPTVISLNAASYGVPQLRERVFIVASRDGLPFVLPEETHLDPEEYLHTKSPFTTAWDAIGDLDTDIFHSKYQASGKWAKLLPSIPEGRNYLWHTERMGGIPLFGWRTRFWSFLLKLSKDRPSWTIQAQPGPATGPFHWKSRLLTSRELARIQTFPDDYLFSGGRRKIQKQIGNAVPPAIGELFGLEIRRQFFGERVRRKLKLIPQYRSNMPPPENVSSVPTRYLEMAGEHKPHPGTGKGPSARLRVKS